MDIVANLALGLQTAFTAANLLYCLAGVFLGTLIGVLPGLGPTATIAMLLPATFTLPPVSALIMLAGIYYGSQYGGSTTAILVNLPAKRLGRHGARRISDGAAGTGGRRARHRRDRLVLRRHRRDVPDRARSVRPWRTSRCGSAPPSTSR